MGKHAKAKVKGGRHAKPASHPIAKKAAAVGATAAAVPMAGAMFAAPAHAATGSQWDQVAQCESNGRWHIESGDPEGPPGTGASAWGGGLQFQPASWDGAVQGLVGRGIDVSHFGVHASSSSRGQQILAAEELLAEQGPGAWATVSSGCASLSGSMFNGGPNPWGLLGTAVPASVLAGTDEGAPAPVPVPTPTPVPAPVPGHHHWRHHHHHGWHHKPVTPPPVPVPVAPPIVPTPGPVAPASCDHIVVKGDTVSGVASSVGAPLAAVEAVNPSVVTPPRPGDYSLIFAGGHIHMPAGFCATGS